VACPPSRVYRARKFVRQHRVGVIAGSGILAALVVGLALALVGFNQARRQRSRAEKEAAIAKAVNDFLQKDLLEQADPDNEPDRDLKLRTAVDRAAAKVQNRFTNQPLVEAAIRLTLSATYGGLGDYATAEAHAQRAVALRTQVLGPEHPDTLDALGMLGWTYGELGRNEEAERLWQSLWQTSRRVLGEEHTNTLSALYGLGSTYLNQERYAKAEEVYVGLVDTYRRLLGPEHPDTIMSMHQLALVYGDQLDKAVEVNLRVLESSRKVFGPEHPNILTTMGNLAMCYDEMGRFAEAIQLQEQVVTAKRKLLGPDHPSTLFAVGNLAEYYGQGCRWQPCAALCKEILRSTNAEFRANAVWGTPAGFMFKGAVASLLAGDSVSYRYFASELLNRFRATTNGGWARTVLEIDFLVPDASRDWATYLRLADLVQSNAPAMLDANNKLALGMLEFRRGRWDEALQYLEPARGSGRSPIASQAGCFAAMTYHQRGQSDAARAALAQATRRLATFIRSGSFDSSTWHEYGRAAIARAEAEQMILGQTVSELLTPTALEATRQAWAPVRQRFLEAQRFAAQANWLKARDSYLQAMAEPVFDWEAAEAAESWLLAPKVGAVFVRAQDWTNHGNLCARLATYLGTLSDPDWSRTYASIRLIATNGLPPELVRKAVGWGRQGSADLDRFNLGPGMEGDRLGEFGLSAGMAAYRAGEYERAITVLVTEPNPKAVGIAGTALAFRSMSLFQLGRQAEAREVLLQAENLLAQPLKNLTGDVWYRLAFAQVALEEAQRLIRPSDKPREASG